MDVFIHVVSVTAGMALYQAGKALVLGYLRRKP